MPRTSSGQNVEAATANAQPTATLMSTLRAGSESSTATSAPAATASRSRGTLARDRSCERPPASAISSPEDVERNAANAPAATIAVSTEPQPPGTISPGSTTVTVSVSPPRTRPGVNTRPSSP